MREGEIDVTHSIGCCSFLPAIAGNYLKSIQHPGSILRSSAGSCNSLLGLYLAKFCIWPGIGSSIMSAGGDEAPGAGATLSAMPAGSLSNSHSCVKT